MTRINLLPWREIRRKQLTLQILRGSMLAWVLMGLVVFSVNLNVDSRIENQEERNTYLKEEIAKVEKEILAIRDVQKKRAALIARMEVIQRLQRDRTKIVHVFDDLVKKLPEGLYLTGLTRRANGITLKGVAQSNGRVSSLMRRLDASPWFTNPNLDVINVANRRGDRKSTRLNSSHTDISRMPSSA